MKRSFWFQLLMAIMLVLVSGVLYRAYLIWSTNDYLFKEHFDLEDSVMPTWYPMVSLGLGLLSLIGVVLTYFYRKIGIYMTITGLFLTVIIQPEFMPDGTLYALFALFFFIGYGLAVIIPHWKEFK